MFYRRAGAAVPVPGNRIPGPRHIAKVLGSEESCLPEVSKVSVFDGFPSCPVRRHRRRLRNGHLCR